jgi:hypothetical protein
VRSPTLLLQAIGVDTGCQMMMQILKMAWTKAKRQPLLRGATVKALGAFDCCGVSKQTRTRCIEARGFEPATEIGRICRGKRTPTPTKKTSVVGGCANCRLA